VNGGSRNFRIQYQVFPEGVIQDFPEFLHSRHIFIGKKSIPVWGDIEQEYRIPANGFIVQINQLCWGSEIFILFGMVKPPRPDGNIALTDDPRSSVVISGIQVVGVSIANCYFGSIQHTPKCFTGYATFVTDPDKKPGQGSDGDVVYGAKKYKNFELSIDWKAGKATNSGIFYNVREVPGKPIYYAAPEVQVLDNKDAGDNKIDNHLAGSLYDMLPCDPKTVHPAGEWNIMVIRVKDGAVTHVMNGVEVVKYTLWTPEWDAMVAKSKFKSFPGFTEGIAKEGFIGLQDHGYACWFRNVKIREL